MTRLMEAILNDPAAVFEFEATLPSGNVMSGTIGPIIGDKLCSHIGFSANPASDEDIRFAKSAMDECVGSPAAMVAVSQTKQEREAAAMAARRFLGGGQG